MKRRKESITPSRLLEDSGVAGSSFDTLLNTSRAEDVAGKIESLQMINFMCHSNCVLNFNSRINFITGRNGSGKSAIMAALTVVLGGSASLSNRGKKISDLIKKGETSATVRVTLVNEGINAYRRDVYGPRVVISRHMTSGGANSYACKSASGAAVSKKKEEVDNIVAALNIQIGNPVCILNQDVARSFLCSTDRSLRFTMFMKATQLEELKVLCAKTLDAVVSAKKELKLKDRRIQEADEEMSRLKEKLEYFAALEKRVQERVSLENEYLWSLVVSEEQQLKSLKERKIRLLEQREEWTREEANSENVVKELEEGVTRCQGELEERRKAKENKSGEVAVVQRELRGMEKEIQMVEAKLRLLIQTLERQSADIRGVEEHLQKNESMASQSQAEREETRRKMKALQERVSETRERIAAAQRQLAGAEENEHQNARILEKVKADVEELEQNKSRLERTLSDTRAKGQNSYFKYGPHTQELLQAIEDAFRRNCFRRKPVGPCGMHVTLSGDPKWARAVESLIGGLMTTYCCDNQKDYQVLSRIMDRICGNRKPPVIISQFLRTRHDVRSGKVSLPGFPSVLDVLSFDNDVVFNTFVDQASVEQILLFESDQQAASILTHIQNVPRNLKMGLTVHSDQYFPAPNYRTYYGDSAKVLKFFDKLSKGGDAVKRLEEELKETQRTLLEKREELRRAEADVGKLRAEVNLQRNSLKRLRHEEGNVQVELTHLKDLEDTRPVTITKVALEEELESLQRKHKESSDEASLRRNELDVLRGTRDNCARRLNSLALEETAMEEAVRQSSEELEKTRWKQREVSGKKKGASERMAELNGSLKALEEEIRRSKRNTDRRKKQAEEVCPERVDTERSPVEVQNLLRSCERHLETAERLGSREAAIADFKSKKALVDEMKRKRNQFVSVIETLTAAALKREQRLKESQNCTANLVSLNFQATLKTRGYDGDLKVDFENKFLDLEVRPRAAGVARKDSKTLSGGERSYSTVALILAIWKVVHMPFYFLDEFDVFMDRLNRKFIMDLLLNHAEFQSNEQFVFITPQDISDVTASDLVSIFRMEDPERGAA